MDNSVKTEIIRVRQNDESGNWRAMVFVGDDPTHPKIEDNKWFTLNEDDIKLIVRCGYLATAFDNIEYVFKEIERPMIELRWASNRTRLELKAVYSMNHGAYFRHNDEIPVAIKKQEEVAPIDIIKQQLEKSIRKRREDRNKQREEEGRAAPTGKELLKEEAEILVEIVAAADNAQDNLGKIQLAAFSKLRFSSLFRELKEDYNGVADIVRDRAETFKNPAYAIQLAQVVDRIFPTIQAMERAGKPYLHPTTGQPITVDYLIAADGLIKKLRDASSHFEKSFNDADRRELIGCIVSGTTSKVQALIDKQSAVTMSDKIVARIEPDANNPSVSIITMRVDDKKLAIIRKLLKSVIEVAQ